MNGKIFHCLTAVVLTHSALSATRYVDLNATGANNGTSWTNAYVSLQSALTAAAAGDEIRVAQGTYHPSVDETGDATPTDSRTRTFFLNKDIALYGGFKGDETDLDDRDVDRYQTTLSGDIGVASDNADNCYHVLLFENVSNSCRLDGFFVRHGNADTLPINSKSHGSGAFLRATTWQTSPTIANSRFIDNHHAGSGTVYLTVFDNDDNTKFINTLFDSNFGEGDAADHTSALHSTIRGLTTQNLSLTNCVFTRNTVTAGNSSRVISLGAAAAPIAQMNVEMHHCSIAGNSNSATPIDFIVLTGASMSFTARNSVFYHPGLAETHSEIFASPNTNSTMDLDYCLLSDPDCAAITRPGITVICGPNMFYGTDPQFASIASGNLHQVLGSPLIDAGGVATAATHDYHGQPRPLLEGVDIGAYESPGPQSLFTTIEIDENRHPILKWRSQPGETYTIRQGTTLDEFVDIATGWPSSGAYAWTQEYVDQSVDTAVVPKGFYQVIRE